MEPPQGSTRTSPKAGEQTADDPTGGGYFCGKQLRQDYEDGHRWCRNRAGFKTDHPDEGYCHLHGGRTRSHRESIALKGQDLIPAAMALFGRAIVGEQVTSQQIRAAENVMDRFGFPRRHDVDVQAGREMAEARLRRLLTDGQENGDG